MISRLPAHKIPILLLLVCCAFYWSFAYDLQRSDFIKLLGLYSGLFFLSWKLFQLQKNDLKFLIFAAILFRGIFLFSVPNLSPDFYRFLWDGNLLLEGINPYLSTPAELAGTFSQKEELYNGMSSLSKQNPTSYPPLNQVLFALAAFFGGKSIFGGILALRIIILAADVGIFYFGRKLLKSLDLPENRIFWYLLNPLIIIELTGNLHFEGMMLFFLLTALYLLSKKKWISSAVLFACSVSIKLIPLIFLPLLFRKLKFTKALFYSFLVGLVNALLFLPFLSVEFFQKYSSSIGLWFQKFEFNASIWYVIRWIGLQIEGYNILIYAGPILAVLIFLFVLLLSFFGKKVNLKRLLVLMLLVISIYFFLATTMHPWYLATPLLLSVFTRLKFALVWSFVVVFSYFTYSSPEFEENLWLLALEYLAVFGVLIRDLFRYKSDTFPQRQ